VIKPNIYIEAVFNLVGGTFAGNDEGPISKFIFYDNQATPTDAKVDAEVKRLQAEYDAQEYARNRALEYPALAEQLDEIFHNGIDSWKAVIKVTKDKYPK